MQLLVHKLTLGYVNGLCHREGLKGEGAWVRHAGDPGHGPLQIPCARQLLLAPVSEQPTTYQHPDGDEVSVRFNEFAGRRSVAHA